MTFIDWDPLARAGVFGGIFLLSLFAVLWLWYDTSVQAPRGSWAWRIISTLLVVATVPAIVLGAANLDPNRETLLNIFAWMAIGTGAAALIAVIAYAVWGRETLATGAGFSGGLTEPLPATLGGFPADGTVPAYQGGDAFDVPPTAYDMDEPGPVPPPRPRRAFGHFVVKSGPDRGRQYPLYESVRIGRSKSEIGADGIVIDDRRVSGAHAQVKFSGGEFVFTDLNSTNGSFLVVEGREERLRGSQALIDGDEVRIGHTVLKLIDASSERQRR